MRTLHVALRVEDLERSLPFYAALGYSVVGTVEETAIGKLTMLKLPDDPFVTLEIVHDPARGAVEVGTGIDHLVVQVDSLDATGADLLAWGLDIPPAGLPAGEDGPQTLLILDPDGYPIELVQWPAGHHVGVTEAEFPS
jgi:lactoylglutathione lyase